MEEKINMKVQTLADHILEIARQEVIVKLKYCAENKCSVQCSEQRR